MTVKPGFRRSQRDVARKRESNVLLAAAPGGADLERFGAPIRDLGDDRMAYTTEISRLWAEAQDRFLRIGRYLLRAKEKLPHGSFETMIADELPFGRHVAWQLRTIATAVDGGRLIEDELPHSYATAFKLASLDDDALERAKAERIVRPDVTRAEITSFVRRVAEEREGRSSREQKLLTEKTDLQRRLNRLASEERVLRDRLAEIGRELQALAP